MRTTVKPFLILCGRVVRGCGLGRKLGFPTANVLIPRRKMPEFGVYRVEAYWEGKSRPAVCNVGIRPTMGAARQAWVEVHIPGFNGELYGQELTILFLARLRDEKRFESLEELKAQIRRDLRAALKIGVRGAKSATTRVRARRSAADG